MKIVKQKLSLPIIDLNVDQCRSLTSKHGDLLPSSIRCIICGPSNCGKTNAMISLILDPNGLRFQNVCVYSKSLNQSKYQFLREVLKSVEGLKYSEYSENDVIISPHKVKEDTLYIFDDVICDKQDKIQKYFSMGRHNGTDVFYLSQSYARTPKHLIRDNVNMLVLFKQDDLNLKHIYEDHVGVDMTFQKFKDMCNTCWNDDKNKHGFIAIVKDNDLTKGRYRKGFDAYIHP